MEDKEDYIVHLRNFKKALDDSLKLEKVHEKIKFNHKDYLKTYIDLNTALWKIQIVSLKKKLQANKTLIFGKAGENVQKFK